MESGMDYGLSFIPGFYFIGRLFMRALPEDGNAASFTMPGCAITYMVRGEIDKRWQRSRPQLTTSLK